MSRQQQQQQRRQTKPSFDISIEISWVSNLTVGRNVFVKWKYSPLEHGKTEISTVSVNEKADFTINNFSDDENIDEENSENVENNKRKKKTGDKKKAHKSDSVIEMKNKKKFHELSFVLGEVDEKGRRHEIGQAFLCLPSLARKTLDRNILLEFEADPKKSSTLLINKRPILCIHTKVMRL